MHKFCFGLLGIILTLAANAQYPGFSLLKNQDAFKQAFKRRRQKIHSVLKVISVRKRPSVCRQTK